MHVACAVKIALVVAIHLAGYPCGDKNWHAVSFCETADLAALMKAEAPSVALVGEVERNLDHLQQLCSIPLHHTQACPYVVSLYHTASSHQTMVY